MKRALFAALLALALLAPAARGEAPVDLDLSGFGGNVAYSQVTLMLQEPDAYLGQTLRVRGKFFRSEDAGTGETRFAVLVADMTACCAQTLRLIWPGDHEYPEDCPELYEDILVTGRFEAYDAAGEPLPRLEDAEVLWTPREER